MKVLIFSQYYYPEQFLLNEIAEQMVTDGHEVTVVTGLPNYPSGVVEEPYRHGRRRDEIVNGVHVIRCSIIPRGHNKLQLVLNYLTYMFSANRKAKKLTDSFDVVFLYQLTPILQAYPAIKYCGRTGLKLFSYNCDLAPLSGLRLLKYLPPLKKSYIRFSKWAMNACDLVGETSKTFIAYNRETNGMPSEKLLYMPQHAPDTMLSMDLNAEENGIADFMFAGNIGNGTYIQTVAFAAEKIRDLKNFRIHIVGDGSYLPTLKSIVSEKGLDEFFVFHGRFPMNEMPELYRLADALLITLRPGQITVPSKLQTYMTAGKPIFGAMDSAGAEVIAEAQCGACVPAADADALAEVMRDYILHPENYSTCGDNARAYFSQHFTKEMYMNTLYDCLSRLAK